MKASTIAEVVAGEMTYKGDLAAQWGDALGIASVIANRAKAYGVSLESVISAPGQFNAYNKSLPKGVGPAQIARAQKALDTVAKYGPSTAATHYARPEATKNIKGWSSFNVLDHIPGSHVFAIDQQMRPIRTVTGTVQAQPNAFQDLMDTARIGAIKTVQSIAHLPQAVESMAKQGYNALTGTPQDPLAAAQAATFGQTAGLYPGSFQYAPTVPAEERNMNPALRDALLGASAERQRSLGITSAHRTPQHNREVGSTSASLHLTGNAVDIDMTGMPAAERQSLMTDLMQRGVTRFSAYSNLPNTLHADFGTPLEPNVPNFMFNKSKVNLQQAPGWYRDFANSVIANKALPTPSVAPTPQRNPSGPMQGPPMSAIGPPQGPGAIHHPSWGAETLRRALATARTEPAIGPMQVTRLSRQDALSAIKDTAAPARTAPAHDYGAPGGPVVGSSPPVSGSGGIVGMGGTVGAGSPPIGGPTVAQGTTPAVGYGRLAQTMGQTGLPHIGISPAMAASMAVPAVADAIQATKLSRQDELSAIKDAVAPASAPVATPSLIDVGKTLVPDQPAPIEVATPKVAAVQPVVREQVVKTRVATPAPAIAPAAPPPPSGFFATLQNAVEPMAKPFHTLANLAGPVPNPPTRNIGTGSAAISNVLSGQAQAGDTAYSRSMPGYSVRDLGNMVEKTNQYGVKSYEKVDKPGGIFSGRPTSGGLLSNFGLGGLAPSVGGFLSGLSGGMFGGFGGGGTSASSGGKKGGGGKSSGGKSSGGGTTGMSHSTRL